MSEDLAWIILFLPLASALIITLGTLRFPALSARISIGAVAISFVGSLLLFVAKLFADLPAFELTADWLQAGNLRVPFGFRYDSLSALMLLIVTGVGSLIQIYSYAYMKGDAGFSRFFASLSLFTFSMLGIVVSSNFFQMFIFWELVGVSSYLLIGFWYERPAAADACKKAFITNRLGDFGFLLGIILIWATLNSVHFAELQTRLVKDPAALGSMATIAGLLIFCGAMGKSAQFPLHVWLPDAMEGPTPVSALIHAATMVAAGVYMLARVFFLYTATPAWPEALHWLSQISALDVIGWIGGITALLAAVIAVQQSDIKRILAYSTLSQLGYMVMAVGMGAPNAAMFHLTTHAFFKALLFLGAGSVIHAMHHEQDIWKMGALRKRMPTTYWTFLIGTLALAGVPPLSGFYSKDSVLAAAAAHSIPLFVISLIVALLTTFYMFRLVLVAFHGPEKSEAASHAHESPRVMTIPLVILAVLSVIAGLIGLEPFLTHHFPMLGEAHPMAWADQIFAPLNHSPLAALFGLFMTLFGFSIAWSCYAGSTRDPLPQRLGALSRAMSDRFYFDEIYSVLIAITHEAAARLANWFDRWIISGLVVRGTHGTTELLGRALRLVQTGNVQTYAFLFTLGVVVVLYLVLLK